MLSRIYHALAVIALATMLALGGFGGFLVGTGKLTGPRVEKLAAVLRGELDQWPEAPTSQPTSQPAGGPTQRAQSAEEIRSARLNEQMQRATLERAARDVLARQTLLDKTLQHLISEEERFEQQRTAWNAEKQALSQSARDEGFQRELEYVGGLAPRQAKDHLLRTWNKDRGEAVRLINGLDTDRGKRILAELKTPEELEILHELLEQLRAQDIDKLIESGRTPDDKPN